MQLRDLIEGRELHQAVIESTSDLVSLLDLEGCALYVSPSHERILGYPVERLSATSPLELVPPDDLPNAQAAIGAAAEGGEPMYVETHLRASDGRWVPVEGTVTPIRGPSDRIHMVLVTWRDVTERRRMEEALRDAEQKYRTLVAQLPLITYLDASDKRSSNIYTSPQVEALLGYSTADWMKDPDLFEKTLHPDDRRRVLEERARTLATGEPLRTEYRLLGRDGRVVWFQDEAVVVRGGDGFPRFLQGYLIDITERKRLETQLLQSQKMEAVGRLAGGVAHDFNNLLTGIIGYADLLRTGLPADHPLRGDAEEIRKAADRAAGLTRQLLAFSRQQVLEPRVIDLNDVVSDMGRMLRRLIGEDVRLVTEAEPELGRVEADPGQIEQVLANLVINSRDAMPEGGRLLIETANAEVDETPVDGRLAQMPPGQYVVLAVTDSGLGMDAETQARIFEPFFTTKEIGKGTGLGLATVYGIVKQSGGFIWVYSEPGVGTTFKIYLPTVEKAAGDGPQPEPARTGSADGSETVLVVEDEELVRDLIARELERRGYSVIAARNGSEALALAQEHGGRIDLLVTDIVMPELGGPELARRLTAARPELKVVYMSGHADRAVAAEVSHRPLLQKPFMTSVLAEKVREVLDVAPAA